MAMPIGVVEEQELVPGGDLRFSGNTWLRKVWDDVNISRVPREAEFRNIVAHLVSKDSSICFLSATNTYGCL